MTPCQRVSSYLHGHCDNILVVIKARYQVIGDALEANLGSQHGSDETGPGRGLASTVGAAEHRFSKIIGVSCYTKIGRAHDGKESVARAVEANPDMGRQCSRSSARRVNDTSNVPKPMESIGFGQTHASVPCSVIGRKRRKWKRSSSHLVQPLGERFIQRKAVHRTGNQTSKGDCVIVYAAVPRAVSTVHENLIAQFLRSLKVRSTEQSTPDNGFGRVVSRIYACIPILSLLYAGFVDVTNVLICPPVSASLWCTIHLFVAKNDVFESIRKVRLMKGVFLCQTPEKEFCYLSLQFQLSGPQLCSPRRVITSGMKRTWVGVSIRRDVLWSSLLLLHRRGGLVFRIVSPMSTDSQSIANEESQNRSSHTVQKSRCVSLERGGCHVGIEVSLTVLWREGKRTEWCRESQSSR